MLALLSLSTPPLGRTTLILTAVIAAIAIAMVPITADGQRTGSLIGHDATTDADAVAGLRMIAACYQKRRTQQVRLWLDTLPGDETETKLLSREADFMSPCLDSNVVIFDGKALKFQAAILRRPVAVFMARALIPSARTFQPAPDTPAWFEAKLANVPKGTKLDGISLMMQDFGNCVVVAQWSKSLLLIRSTEDSPEEAAAFAGLVPTLGPCLSAGSSFKVTRRNLRELLAEPAYHLMSNAGAVGGNK